MGKRHPLETRFAIADAFDSGLLSGVCSVNEIADAVGANRKSVGRTLQHMAFHLVRKPCAVTESIPARWAPPQERGVRWPVLTRSGTAPQAIKGLYDSGKVAGRCYARDLAPLVGVSEETVVHALRRLRFKVVKRAHMKFVRMEPATWRPPAVWPPLFQKQREMHRAGVSAGQIATATTLSAEIKAIIERAVRDLELEEIPLNKRGALKTSITKTIKDIYADVVARGQTTITTTDDYNTIARQELAEWLKESEDANPNFLKSRVTGYVRYASNKICQHCGKRPAKL